MRVADFFAGPSVIIGKGDRIVLSAGVMGGRGEMVGQGGEIGDSYFSASRRLPSPVCLL